MILSLVHIENDLVRLVEEKTGEKVQSFKSAREAGTELSKAEIIIAWGMDRETLEACSSLKWLFILSAGVDRLPFDDMKRRSITVSNVRGVHKSQIAEHAMGMMIAFSRQLNFFLRNQHKGIWERVFMDELKDKTLCIIGAGSIGQEIGRKAKAFDMKVLGIKAHPQSLEHFDEVYGMEHLHDVLKQGDYVVLVTPLTDETYELMGSEEFSAMKPGSVFINVSRGKTVDEKALLQALRHGPVSGAGLDVFRTEPLGSDSPFWSMDNVIVTPHCAGDTPYYMQRAMDIFVSDHLLYRQGKPPANRIDLERKY